MITIKKVDMSLETAYQLNKLGLAITLKNGNVQIEREA